MAHSVALLGDIKKLFLTLGVAYSKLKIAVGVEKTLKLITVLQKI